MSLSELLLLVTLSSLVQAQSRGELRLVRSSTTSYSYTSGRLEIYMNGRWGTICSSSNFGINEATVACKQLGWTGASSYGRSRSLGFGVGNGTILLDNVNCYSTSYLHLLSCQYRTFISSFCDHTDDVAITCYSSRLSDIPYELKVRLVGGSYPSQGRVEVYCNGQWGTICSSSGFGATEAATVCRQLGYTSASGYNHLLLPGSSFQPIWLRYFSCGTYSDSCLDLCTSCPLRGITSCTHSRDITVQCDYQHGSPSRQTTCPSRSNTGGGGSNTGGGGGSNIGGGGGSNIGGGGGSNTDRPTTRGGTSGGNIWVIIGEAVGGTIGGLITLCCICVCICLCVAGLG